MICTILKFIAAGWVCCSSLAVDFNRDIRPILSANCFYCHGPDEEDRKADLRLDLKDGAFAEHDGVAAIVPGDLEASELWYRIISTDPDDIMPPPESKKVLTAEQKALVKQWLEEGAEWTEHWAFIAPAKGDVAKNTHPIDQFVSATLAEKNLKPSPPADARTLVRRLHLDLTGLPPTPEVIRNFVSAHAADPVAATEAQIDTLMASPHYGERMALMWLDAGRYGDTSVMHADGPRDMWPWRDWVVNAYNDNKPYDVFSIEQLAGDLLPEATIDQKVASGFNRNHATSDEGGAIAEELRVEYVVDRVRTTANVWMGLTMECAQCHDHKYDPISHREYFQFYAYFNNHADPGMQSRNGNQAPVVTVVTKVDDEKLAAVRKQIKTHEAARDKARKDAGGDLAAWRAQTNLVVSLEGPEPKDLKHSFAADGVIDGLALDLVSGKEGVVSGNLKSVTPKTGRKHLQFTGNGSAAFENFPNLDFKGKPFTFTAWLNVPKGAGGAVFSDMDVSSNYRGYDLWLQGGAVGTHIINSWPNNAVKVVSKEPLPPDTWQHVAITWDGKGRGTGVVIRVNGKIVETKIEADKLTGSTSSKAPFRLNGRSPGATVNVKADQIRIYQRILSEEEIALTARDALQFARATEPGKRSAQQKKMIDESFYLQHKPYRDSVVKLGKAQAEEKTITEGKVTSMVMADNPMDKMRATYILDRGAYDAPKKEEALLPGVPAILPPMIADAPANRLSLAQWLFTDEHPLTSRVYVNMIWQMFFGYGLVTTPGDFGAQGAYPTHPELLDWLAVDFKENAWDVKRLVRMILTSDTYLQQSRVSADLLALDPENKLLARAPRFRLQAEFVRDNALSLAGILNTQLGGPGVKPFQPPGLWAEVSLGGNPKFVQDKGDKLYRRSIYTYWKRSAPAPNMQLFDAPTREICVMKRPRTNTPLQALVTMNDKQYIEMARHLAERLFREGGDSPEARHAYGFELATGQEANTTARAAMKQVYDDALASFTADADRAKSFLDIGDSPRDESLPLAEHAASTLLASLLLNLDATLTRE